MAQEYIFKVRIHGIDGRQLWRKVAVRDSVRLYDLAAGILNAFDFDMDHAFGFFEKAGWGHLDSEKRYELFTDLEEEGVEPTGAGSVKKTKVKDVWKKKGDTMHFLFDYGDDWWFAVKLERMDDAAKGKYPRVVDQKGDAPEQYPDYDEEENDDDEYEEGEWVDDGEENVAFERGVKISTGLGWKNGRIRFFFVIHKSDKKPFVSKEKVLIKKVVNEVASQYEGLVESVEYEKNSVLVGAAMPMTVAVAEYIDGCLGECKLKGITLDEEYLVTNVSKPTTGIIQSYLQGKIPPGFLSS